MGRVFVPRFVNRQNAIPKEAAEAAARIPAAVPDPKPLCHSSGGYIEKCDGETAKFFIRNISASQSIPPSANSQNDLRVCRSHLDLLPQAFDAIQSV